MLGFLKRTSDKFKFSVSLKSVYCAFVRPILKYGSVVWNCWRYLPYTRKSFRRVYDPVRHALNLQTLSDYHLTNDLSFLSKLVKLTFFFLQYINFRVPTCRSRNPAPLVILPCHNNHLSNEPLTRPMKLANKDPRFSFS